MNYRMLLSNEEIMPSDEYSFADDPDQWFSVSQRGSSAISRSPSKYNGIMFRRLSVESEKLECNSKEIPVINSNAGWRLA